MIVDGNFRRVDLIGAPVDIAELDAAVEWTLRRAALGLRTSVAGVNAALAVLANEQPGYAAALREFDLVLADGYWAASAASLVARTKVPHANTVPFVRSLIDKGVPGGTRIFLLGARLEVVRRAAEVLPELHPGAAVVGWRDGYFGREDEAEVVSTINRLAPSLLLIGISSPKKELFVRRHWNELEPAVSVGVGGLFDIWAGVVKEAPDWMRRSGLEWVHRFAQDPQGLRRRYTVTNGSFIRLVVGQIAARARTPGVHG